MRLVEKALAFNAGQGDAAYKVALQQEENEENGQRDDDGAGHQAGPAGVPLPLYEGYAELDGKEIFAVEEDERAEEVVPGGHKGEDAQGGQGGLSESGFSG